jgi:hypothetical protein
MTRTTLTVTLCIGLLGIGACNSNDSVEVKKLRDELEASKAENARLKAEVEALKSRAGNENGAEEEFTDSGDFSRLNSLGKYDFSYKKIYARPPELVIETPKTSPPSIGYEVTERRLDGFTIQYKSATYDSSEEFATYLKNLKWRVKGMTRRSAN